MLFFLFLAAPLGSPALVASAQAVPVAELPPEIVDAVRGTNQSIEDLLKAGAQKLPPGRLQKVAGDYDDKELIVFVSSSMPDEIVRRYMEQAEGIEDSTVFVLRGFVGGIKKFGPTREYVVQILCGTAEPGSKDCLTATVDVNPDLFETFGVQAVPAFLVVSGGGEDLSGCGDSVTPDNWWLAYGDASLQYQLVRIEKVSGDQRVTGLIKRLKRSYYDCIQQESGHEK